MLTSCICRFDHFNEPWFFAFGSRSHATVSYHRKDWEFAAISQALSERGCLTDGKKGLGFAVGTEPLVSRFASMGARVIATDVEPGATADPWAQTGQHAASKEALFKPDLVTRQTFDDNVEFRWLNMLRPEQFPTERFDFVWSACAFEHLGSLDAGLDFVKQSSRLLKPGGFAVHTTEYNVWSNTKTIDSGGVVLYRWQDLERLGRELNATGYWMDPVDPNPGTHQFDRDPDVPPYYTTGRQHVKLQFGEFVTTSAMIIIQAKESST